MAVTPLNNTQIKNSKPKDKEYNLSDGQGLSIRIMPNGGKYWIFNYTHPTLKKRRNLSLGPYPEMTLAKAREIRSEYRELIRNGIDPKTHKIDLKNNQYAAQQQTLKLTAEEWFKVKQTEVSANYAEDVWNSLELHIFPSIGNTPLIDITAPKTIEVIKPIAAKGSLETVKRLCQRLNEIMTYAVNTGLVHSNPLTGIKAAFASPQKKSYATLKPEELGKLMKDISYASIKRTTRLLIEWQLHTMTRPSEAVGAKWEEIDFDKELWIIPAERMKKNLEHRIPLTPQTLSILDMLKPISAHREHLFPADRNPRSHMNEQSANAALKRMGYGGKLVAHGMRALASTTLNEEGFDPDVIEAALAHLDKNEVRRAYNRAEYIEKRREMMCWWSNHIEKANS
ncbi:integrase domain-containing protein [Pseudoalteromonas sp. T1lg75]|uniref:integrase domain-containing protein n=1 Tax=Pseudoalteromonas sp. T1lg75 TaxID=2077102 RepID=UPI000CF71DAE|nr:integrase domain-containing protein [Pseudoalteromonas sp. T1lg75]